MEEGGQRKEGLENGKERGSKGARKRREGTILQEKCHKYPKTT